MATNHGSIEFLKFPNPQYPGDDTKLIKKWLRDSWARRKIVALQQTIADIVVPTKTSQLTNDSGFITQADIPPGSTASSTTPKMDGTASVGTETAFARGDHRHPTDTSRQAVLSSTQMAAVNSGITSTKVAAYDAIEVPTKTSELTNDSDFVTSSEVPTKTSELTNDSGFITASAVPTATSDLTNDSGFITASDVPTKTSELTNDSGFMTSYTETDPTVPAWAKSATKPTYTASEVGALPDDTVIPTVPTNVSAFQNDAGYITGFTETDPTVPAWAKASTKPTYTASEVGALPDTTEIPSKTSDLTNDSGFITASSVPSAYTSNPRMDGTASAGSSTAWARGDHRHPTDTSRQAALSSTQLAAVNSGVTAAKVQEWDSIVVPTKTSELTNDSGFITSVPVQSVNGKTGAVNLGAADVGALPNSTVIPTVPSNVSAFTNDAGYITASDVPDAAVSTPVMDGTGAVGSSTDYARADHVHPHDTSKQDVLSSAQMDAVNSGITAAKITEYDSIVTMFGVPEIIRSGDDLNDFMTPGHYSANSGTIASALVNCPTTINFSLFVFYRTITLLSQMIITSSTTIFVRHRNSSGWTSWYKFIGTAV